MKSNQFIHKTKVNVAICTAAFILLNLFSGCASLTGYQDGKAIGKNLGEVFGSLNFSQSPEFDIIDDTTGLSDIPKFTFPNLELGGRFGVTEKLDIMARVNTNLNLGVGVKYQVLGDRKSPFALALGTEVGTFGLILGLWNVQIPLYTSYHPSESFAIYASPRYIYQFTTVGDISGWNYLGGNLGILIGRKHKFGIDAGFYQVGANGVKAFALNSFGIGGKFVIGNSEESENAPKTKKKRKP